MKWWWIVFYILSYLGKSKLKQVSSEVKSQSAIISVVTVQ
jgi:hypothetical protein